MVSVGRVLLHTAVVVAAMWKELKSPGGGML